MIYRPDRARILKIMSIISVALVLGCSEIKPATSQKSDDKVANQLEASAPVEYKFDNGVLVLHEQPPCSIVFKQSGRSDYEKRIGDCKSGRAVYVKLLPDVKGPEAIIEWTLTDGRYINWIFSSHPEPHVTNVFATGQQQLGIYDSDEGKEFRVAVDKTFSELSGAHQIIVPITYVWSDGKFELAKSKKKHSLTSAELEEQVRVYKPLYEQGYSSFPPPELEEAVLRLMSDGDDAGAKKLLHACWPKGFHGESKCFKALKKALELN